MSATETDISTDHPAKHAAATAAALAGLRMKVRALLVAQRASFSLAWIFVGVVVVALADYLFRFPSGMRWLAWVAGVCAIFESARRYMVPALRFRPSLTELALRLERAGHAPGGVLASGLELSYDERVAPELAHQASMAASNVMRNRMSGLYNAKRTRKSAIALFGVAGSIAMCAAMLPELSSIATLRVLAPWTATSWPKRTGVADSLVGEAFALGKPLTLRAKVTKFPGDPADAEVKTDVTVTVNGVETYRGRVLLALQHAHDAGSDPIFERLLDIDALLPATVNADDVVEVRYMHSTQDDATIERSVRMVEPPAVTDAKLNVEPPMYLSGIIAPADSILGKGNDDRAQAGPFIAGSRVRLELKLNKPIKGASADGAQLLSEVIPQLAQQESVEATLDGPSLRVSWVAKQSVRASVSLIDEFGLSNTMEHTFRIDVVEDAAPSAAVIEPPQDESVLPGAVIQVAGEGRDDIALESVRVEMAVARRPSGSEGAPPETNDTEMTIATARTQDSERTLTKATATLELAPLTLNEGDEVRLVTAVRDLRIAATPGTPEIRSNVRKLRIISESAFAEQIQNDLSNVREAAKRLVKEQASLSQSRGAAAENADQARDQMARQDAVSDRLNPMTTTIRRLRSKVDRNNPADESIGQLIEDAANAAEEAQEASRRSSAKLDELSRKSDISDVAQLTKSLEESQTRTEDRLDELVRMLERGRDGWAVRRALERIVTEQRQLADQTAAASRELQGRAANELSPAEREDLNRRAQKQTELSQRTRAMIDNMEEQARAMEQADPGLSSSMKSAAQTGRREQISQLQEQAAKRIQENKTGGAQEDQRAATRNLEKMLSELDRAQQRRDEALRRIAAELQESLERLRDMQATELDRLADRVRTGSDVKLDVGMIAVNRATVDAIAKSESMSDSGAVPELLRSASLAQEAAVTLLRMAQPDFGEADANERRSLARVNEAIEELNKIDEDAREREEQRSREELAKVYAEALERQIALNVQVEPLIGKTPGRRERASLMQSGVEQENLRAMLEEQRTKTDGLEDAKVFSYAHDRLNEAMSAAATMLQGADPSMSLKRRQATAARVLGSLVQALRNDPKKDDGLRENESGDDSGGGGGASAKSGLLPPGTELKLLRMMQQEAMERTRALAEDPAADQAELQSVATLQTDLHQRAAELLESLSPPQDAEPPAEENR